MPAEAIEITETAGYPLRKRWTRDQCQALEASGLWERERLELIEGDLISRMGKKRPHVNAMILVMEWLAGVFGARYVNPETPVDVSPEDNPANEPEPDLVVLKLPCSAYVTGNPGPSEVRLLVEISDTTLAFDLGAKLRLYARAGIPEYWVVDVRNRRLVVHRGPGAGIYVDVATYTRGQSVAPLSAPDSHFAVDDAFPELS